MCPGRPRPGSTVPLEQETAIMNKLFLAFGILGLSLFVIPLTASAQEGGGGGGDAASTTYDFEDDLVTGDLVRPDGELLNVRRRGRRASLIRVREHFIPEMLKSVENL
jgi:hypothetical protein